MRIRKLVIRILMSGLLASGAIVPVAAQEKGEKAFVKARNAMIAELAQDPTARRIEPEIYDLTLVVFTDYQCPFCRQMHPRLTALAKEDGNVRIVFKDWAIFGEPSVEAARRALAARYQGRSEEHTSELQSPNAHIVCRLLLDKKKLVKQLMNTLHSTN